jgi:hypothetical protein
MLLTQSRNQHVPVFDGVRRANCSFSLSGVMILQKSRMRRRARTDLCGGRFVRIVPTATVRNFLTRVRSGEIRSRKQKCAVSSIRSMSGLRETGGGRTWVHWELGRNLKH